MKKFWLNNKKIFRFVIPAFIIWTLALCLLNFTAQHSPIPQRSGFNYSEYKIFNPPFFWNWANFDGIHYLDIARKGYGIYQQAFFPFYPQLINFLTPYFSGRNLLAGIFISNLSFFLGLFVFYKLILIDNKDEVAKKTLLFLLLFPTSFFFGMVYTESLFFALVLASFYFARKEKWFWAGVFGALAANTRIVGIFLFPALLLEWWEQYKVKSEKLKVKSFLPILLVPLGLISYMRFLAQNFNDPLMFIHVQASFGAGRSSGQIVLLYQVFWRYVKMISTTRLDLLYYTVGLEFLVAIFFIFLIILSYRSKIRFSYLLFATLAYLTPTLSGTFLSLPRFVLVLFPCFIFLGRLLSKTLRNLIYFVFGLLMVVSVLLFFRGYWIS